MLSLNRKYFEQEGSRMPTANAPSKAAHQHQPSRPNSASSSSIVTVQRAASLSSHSGSRTPHTKIRSQSPSESSYSAPLAQASLSPEYPRGTTGSHSRPNSISGIKEGVGNLNRWSQSTTSSKNSGNGHHRRSSFSRRLSLGGSGSLGSLKSITHPQSPSTRNVLTKSRSSPSKPPPTELPPPPPMSEVNSLGALPAIITLPTLSNAVDAAPSPSTAPTITPATTDLLTPSTFSGADYFSDRWKGKLPVVNQPNEQRLAPSPLESSPATSFQSRNATIDPTKSVSTPESVYSLERVSKPGGSREQPFQIGHTRSTDENGKGSGGTGGGSSASSIRSEKRLKAPSQKAMLSKALAKANTAVLLDNAQNFEGAMEAYADACNLLQQVMDRSAGDEDRRKLEAIRNTYTNRIAELRNLDVTFHTAEGKALPERPMSNDSIPQDIGSPIDEDEEDAAIIETATATRIVNTQSYVTDRRETRSLAPSQVPPRRQSLLPSAFDEEFRFSNASPNTYHVPQRSFSNSPRREVDRSMNLTRPFEADYVPPPLSPRRSSSPDKALSHDAFQVMQSAPPTTPTATVQVNQHTREMSTESTSWLDTIDESGGSSSSSIHSRSSSLGIHRKQLKASAGLIEAEFDAALDAAVEAAYNEGFEVADEYDDDEYGDDVHDEIVTNARRNVELARQKVREVEIEAELALIKETEKKPFHQEKRGRQRGDSIELDYGDDEAEEEERLLEEMTKGYVMDDFEFDLQAKSALPRTSDSSGFSGRTWGSSIGSNLTTAGTSLSTVAEGSHFPSMITQMQPTLPPPHPPPLAPLPAPPMAPLPAPPPHATTQPSHPPPSIPAPRPPSLGSSPGPGVRERRLSGQNVKQLKIETHAKLPPALPKKETPPGPPPVMPVPTPQEEPASLSAVPITRSILPTFQPRPSAAFPQVLPPPQRSPGQAPKSEDHTRTELPSNPALTKGTSQDSDNGAPPVPPSPAHLVKTASTTDGLRKNQSSSSLKSRNLSVSAPDAPDVSPSTPVSSMFPVHVEARKGVTATMPVMPTPTGNTFTINGLPTGGLYLFDNNIHSPNTPGSPNPMSANAPAPLEPCPDSFLLRPFWLMRCLYQTIAHPRGGYISTKLFIPRDVWRIKNVKIKGIDEKVSNCDLLTAALMKFSKVDTYDADAVLNEMQEFETIMDQVQANLSKKLGNEVGIQSSALLFKGSPATEEAASHGDILSSKSTNAPGKSYLASWRKLRSKNSGAGLTTTFTTTTSKDSGRETLSMSSLPMTSSPNSKPPKRNMSQLHATGPNANYMNALARLFDAVQILDQIARQVEDPGLKHSSPTHVGLELSARHASEFFGFYICRFALNDVGMMLDKFIKRGSEWVLV